MVEILNNINDALWGYLIIGALIGCGLWFTWRTQFVQFRMVGEMLRLLTDSSAKPKGSEKHISSFQAFAVSLASRVGTGNLAGVATAIAVGGPGAVRGRHARSSYHERREARPVQQRNYYYGEANVRFMTESRTAMTTYRLLSGGAMVLFGAWTTLDVVWSMIDLCMALLTACNLVAIALLGKYVFRLLDDYRSQKRQGVKEPTFRRNQLPEIEEAIECWE